MRKTRLFAAALAAVSVMSLTVPAFAEDQSIADNNVESSVEVSDEAAISAAAAEMDENAAENTVKGETSDQEVKTPDGSVETEDNTDNAATEENAEAAGDAEDAAAEAEDTQTMDEFEKNIVTVATPSETKIYTNNQNMTVYEAEDAVAYVNPEGTSGRIYINQAKLAKSSDDFGTVYYTIDKVGNVPLQDIVKFNDGGYISSVSCTIKPSRYFDDEIKIIGRGPGFFGGGGHINFTDNTGDTYSKYIYSSSVKEHSIDFNSDNPYIKVIDWYSYYNDNGNFPTYEFKNDTPTSLPNTKIYVNDKGQTVYEAKGMTAYVNSDGRSGHLDIDPSTLDYIDHDYRYAHYIYKWDITSVGDVKLQDIIKFGNSGYVSKIEGVGNNVEGQMDIKVFGSGPNEFFSSGTLKFIPENGSSNDVSIWKHAEDTHDVSLKSTDKAVKTIEWKC